MYFTNFTSLTSTDTRLYFLYFLRHCIGSCQDIIVITAFECLTMCICLLSIVFVFVCHQQAVATQPVVIFWTGAFNFFALSGSMYDRIMQNDPDDGCYRDPYLIVHAM